MNPCPLPTVSVILPVLNEAKYIGRCLQSLLKSTYPPEQWEILVVDGMSTDDTPVEVRRVAARSAVPIRLLQNPRKITPISLNIGLRQARGEVLIRVDAHAEYGDDYIARCVQVLQETGAENVGGPIVTRPGARTRMARAIALMLSHPFGVGNSAFRTGGGNDETGREVDTVPYGCYRREVFRTVGLFDERLARHQDYDLNQRLRAAGGRIVLDRRLTSIYYARPRLRAQATQGWRTGRWNAFATHLHPQNRCARHLLPAFFSLAVALAAGTALWSATGPPPGWLLPPFLALWGVVACHGLVNLIVSTRLARRHGLSLWPSLLAAFVAYHFAYGAGIVYGWLEVTLRRFPWQPDDGIPPLPDAVPVDDETPMAA